MDNLENKNENNLENKGYQKIWLPEFNRFGYKKIFTLNDTHSKLLLEVLNNDELQRLLDTQIENENYEAAEAIKNKMIENDTTIKKQE
jgi:hypothetical protein